jgi:hypothetical protein
VNHGVDLQPADELSDRGVPHVGVHEVHLLQRADRIVDIASEQVRNLRSEPARDLRAEWVGYAGDENAIRSGWSHSPSI